LKRRYKILISLFAVCIVLMGAATYFWLNIEKYVYPTLIPPPSYWVDEDKPLREQTRDVEIAGKHLRIPLMYFNSRPDPGLRQDALLLRVIWPDMRALHELKDRAEYERIWKQERRLGNILLELPNKKTPFNKLKAITEDSLTKFERLPNAYGLEAWLYYRGQAISPEPWEEAYVERDAHGDIVTFIFCAAKDDFRAHPVRLYPTCSHRFFDDGIYYKISYNKEAFFADWKKQQQRAIAFVRAFEIQENTSPKGHLP